MKKYHAFLAIVIGIALINKISAQTFQLSPGDIQIVGVNMDYSDGFSFVSWVNLPPGTQIKFTDGGFLSSASANAINNFRGGESNCTWTAPEEGIPAGNVIFIFGNGTANASVIGGGSASGVLGGLSKSGDQIFAYTGPGIPSGNPSTFQGRLIYGFTSGPLASTGGSWMISGIPNSNQSFLPVELNNPLFNMAFINKSGNSQFNGSRENQPGFVNYKNMISQENFWLSTSINLPLSTSPFIPGNIAGDSTSLIFTEIMYNSEGNDEEWIELFNNGAENVILDPSFSIKNSFPAWEMVFSQTKIIQPGHYATIKIGSSGDFPFTADLILQNGSDRLSNMGSSISLKHQGVIVDQVSYSSSYPWPADAGGKGPSLSLNRTHLDNGQPESWGACRKNGTPGFRNITCAADTFYSVMSGEIGTSGFNSTNEIWADSPDGRVAIKPEITRNTSLIIRSGHHIINHSKNQDVKNIFIETNGSLKTNADVYNPSYLNIYGNIHNDGAIGSSSEPYDGTSFNIEGASCHFTGIGINHLARIRKARNDFSISHLEIHSDISLFFGGTCMYNDRLGTLFNITIAPEGHLRVLGNNGENGSISMDGLNGNDAGAIERGGSLFVRGILDVSGKLFSVSDNSEIPVSFGIDSMGIINVRDMDIRTQGSGIIGVKWDISNGGKLNVSGTLRVLEGTFFAEKGVYLKAGSILLEGTNTPGLSGFQGGLIADTLHIECNSQNNNTKSYNGWSTPVKNSYAGILTGNNPGNSSNLYTYFPEYSTGITKEEQQAGWKRVSTSSKLIPGKGYFATGAGKLIFTGQPNNGNIAIPIIKASHSPFNLLGNPYPGPISVSSFLNQNGPGGRGVISGAIYLWDDDRSGGSDYASGDYLVCNVLGSVGGGNYKSTQYNGNIALGQGFFVEATQTGEVTFENTMRTNEGATFFEEEKETQIIKLTASMDSKSYSETIIAIKNDATEKRDLKYDALKLSGNNQIDLYTLLEGQRYAIQAWELTDKESEIPIGLNSLKEGKITLKINETKNIDPTQRIYLEDIEKGLIHDLKNSEYTFYAGQKLEDTSRFRLLVKPPVKILVKDATCRKENGVIEFCFPDNGWSYSIEHNSVLLDGKEKSIEKIEGLKPGIYKITLHHQDGFNSITYQEIFSDEIMAYEDCESIDSNEVYFKDEINFLKENSSDQIKLYPQPAEEYIMIEFPSEQMNHYTLIDISGRVIENFSSYSLLTTINLDKVSNGIYTLIISDEKEKIYFRILIQR